MEEVKDKMTDSEIKEIAIKKVKELTKEIGSFVNAGRIIHEMDTIIKFQWFLKRKKIYENKEK